MNGHKKRFVQKGSLLLESLISVAIISATALGISRLYTQNSSTQDMSGQAHLASILAEDKLESLKQSASDSDTAYSQIGASSGSDQFQSSVTNFSRNWSITNSVNPNYKTITVSVSWLDKNNNTQSTSLSSRVSESIPSLSGIVAKGSLNTFVSP